MDTLAFWFIYQSLVSLVSLSVSLTWVLASGLTKWSFWTSQMLVCNADLWLLPGQASGLAPGKPQSHFIKPNPPQQRPLSMASCQLSSPVKSLQEIKSQKTMGAAFLALAIWSHRITEGQKSQPCILQLRKRRLREGKRPARSPTAGGGRAETRSPDS